jgi:putative FmdB family regulatory protein
MPIYEYQCTACSHTLEVLQKISDKALTDCPHCNESSLQKMISATSFRLKGSGWYETDFKKKADKKSDKKSDEPKKVKKESKDKSSSSGGKSETDKSS